MLRPAAAVSPRLEDRASPRRLWLREEVLGPALGATKAVAARPVPTATDNFDMDGMVEEIGG